jgi:hypothetical protein
MKLCAAPKLGPLQGFPSSLGPSQPPAREHAKKELRHTASNGEAMDWSRLDRQIAAIREAVNRGVHAADEDAERAGRALERLAALEQLLAAAPAPMPAAVGTRDQPALDEPEPEPAPGRASLRRSALADLFAATEPLHERD